MKLGDTIKLLRQKQNLTQQELSEKVGLKTITIRKYESNEREPNIETLQKIADVFNVPIGTLLNPEFKELSDHDSELNYSELKAISDKAKQRVYTLMHESNLIDMIFEFNGYSITTRKYSDFDYEYVLTDTHGKELLLSDAEISDFTEEITELLKFQITRLLKRHEYIEIEKLISRVKDKEVE